LTIAFLRDGCSEEVLFLSFMVYDFSLVSAMQDCFYQAGQQIIEKYNSSSCYINAASGNHASVSQNHRKSMRFSSCFLTKLVSFNTVMYYVTG